MSVIQVVQKRSRMIGKDATSRTGKRVYMVELSASNDGPDEALTAVDPTYPTRAIPSIGDAWSASVTSLLVQEISVEDVEETGNVFAVTVDYATASRNNPTTQDEDPLERPAERSFSYASTSEEVYQDKEGNAIRNSAGQTFDPSIESEFHDVVVRFVKNVASLSIPFAADMMGAVNDDEWEGVPAGCAKVVAFSGTEKYEAGTAYVEVMLEIQVRGDGYTRKVLDQGLMELDGDGEPVAIKDADGQPITQPVLLDGAGGKLAQEGEPVFLEFDLDKRRPFALLAPYTT